MSANLFNRLGGAGNQLESLFGTEEAQTQAKDYAKAQLQGAQSSADAFMRDRLGESAVEGAVGVGAIAYPYLKPHLNKAINSAKDYLSSKTEDLQGQAEKTITRGRNLVNNSLARDNPIKNALSGRDEEIFNQMREARNVPGRLVGGGRGFTDPTNIKLYDETSLRTGAGERFGQVGGRSTLTEAQRALGGAIEDNKFRLPGLGGSAEEASYREGASTLGNVFEGDRQLMTRLAQKRAVDYPATIGRTEPAPIKSTPQPDLPDLAELQKPTSLRAIPKPPVPSAVEAGPAQTAEKVIQGGYRRPGTSYQVRTVPKPPPEPKPEPPAETDIQKQSLDSEIEEPEQAPPPPTRSPEQIARDTAGKRRAVKPAEEPEEEPIPEVEDPSGAGPAEGGIPFDSAIKSVPNTGAPQIGKTEPSTQQAIEPKAPKIETSPKVSSSPKESIGEDIAKSEEETAPIEEEADAVPGIGEVAMGLIGVGSLISGLIEHHKQEKDEEQQQQAIANMPKPSLALDSSPTFDSTFR